MVLSLGRFSKAASTKASGAVTLPKAQGLRRVAVSNNRLFFELQQAPVDSTVSLFEAGTPSLTQLEVSGT